MTSSHHRKDDHTSFLRKSAHGRICTRTRPHLKRLSLLLDYMGFECGRIPRCCPGPFLVPNQVSTLALSYPIEKWTCAPDSHRVKWTCKPRARLFALRTIKKRVPTAGFAPAPPRSQRGVLLLHYAGSLKGSLRVVTLHGLPVIGRRLCC